MEERKNPTNPVWKLQRVAGIMMWGAFRSAIDVGRTAIDAALAACKPTPSIPLGRTSGGQRPAVGEEVVDSRDGMGAHVVEDVPQVRERLSVGGGTTLRTTTSYYDSAGRITSVVDPNSQYAYNYDNADRVLTVDDSGTSGLPQVTLTYGYDNVGNRTSLDDSKGGLTSYAYDVRDELISVTQSGTGVTSKRADYAYDPAMRLTTLTRFSDLSGSTVVLRTRYSYDSADRLTTLSHETSGGTARLSYRYTLDAADRLTGESRSWGSGASSDSLTYGYTNNVTVRRTPSGKRIDALRGFPDRSIVGSGTHRHPVHG